VGLIEGRLAPAVVIDRRAVALDDQPIRRRESQELAMKPQDGLDRPLIDITAGCREPVGDPGRLGSPLQLRDVLLAPPTI
jgi:hypothetical protein